MRGARGRVFSGKFGLGIIPAYAGSTSAGKSGAKPSKDHPRVCGEHGSSTRRRRSARGSSPRMRGAQVDLFMLPFESGIIPAYAGSTCSPHHIGLCWADHPRVCGEHLADGHGRIRHRGSSPRMRGAPPTGNDLIFRNRIIPAYAGSTMKLEINIRSDEDHPRVCGEHASPGMRM